MPFIRVVGGLIRIVLMAGGVTALTLGLSRIFDKTEEKLDTEKLKRASRQTRGPEEDKKEEE